MAISRTQRVISILWPSFLVAAGATIVFFSIFDPAALLALTPYAELDRLAGYSIGFFAFWLLAAASSLLTCYFQRPTTPRRNVAP